MRRPEGLSEIKVKCPSGDGEVYGNPTRGAVVTHDLRLPTVRVNEIDDLSMFNHLRLVRQLGVSSCSITPSFLEQSQVLLDLSFLAFVGFGLATESLPVVKLSNPQSAQTDFHVFLFNLDSNRIPAKSL